MANWFTADLHLSHANVIRFCNRPFANAQEMDSTIIYNAQQVVGPDDDFYILGDVTWLRDPEEIIAQISRLPGRKHLIRGNHDSHIQDSTFKRAGFVSVNDMLTINVTVDPNSKHPLAIIMCHYPMLTWDRSHYGSWNCHGHCHHTLPEDTHSRRVDVGVDGWNFKPVSMDQLSKVMAKKTFVPIDHHGIKQKS